MRAGCARRSLGAHPHPEPRPAVAMMLFAA
jgi:hypothetical protein